MGGAARGKRDADRVDGDAKGRDVLEREVGFSPEVSRATLEATVGKASQFLFAVGRGPTILNALRKVGYTQKLHQEGWALVNAASRKDIDESATDRRVDDALQLLDDWDESGIAITRAALTQFPEIRDRVLQGIQPIAGPGAALNVEAMLSRLEDEKDSARGKAALKRLAESGIDAAAREELGRLVAIAKGSKSFDKAIATEEEDDRALLALRDWYYEWSEIARQVVKRREHLIRLGLAERRAGEPKDGEPKEEETRDEARPIVVEDPTPFVIEPDPASPVRPG
jgi:hypothetical protein